MFKPCNKTNTKQKPHSTGKMFPNHPQTHIAHMPLSLKACMTHVVFLVDPIRKRPNKYAKNRPKRTTGAKGNDNNNAPQPDQKVTTRSERPDQRAPTERPSQSETTRSMHPKSTSKKQTDQRAATKPHETNTPIRNKTE